MNNKVKEYPGIDIIKATHKLTVRAYNTNFDVIINVVNPSGVPTYLAQCQYENSNDTFDVRILSTYDMALMAVKQMIDAQVTTMKEIDGVD